MGNCGDIRAAQPIQITGMDSRCEVHTIVIDNLDGTYTAHNFDGTTETWNGTNTFTSIVDNGDGTITAVNADGTIITWDKDDQFSTVTDNGDGTITAINIDGSIITWDKTDTFSTLIDNGNGTVTGVNVDGTIITWAKDDTFVTLINNGNGTITGTNVDGTTLTWSQVDTFATITDNGNGTYTAVNASGVVVTWVGGSVIVDNGDGSYTATNGDGSVVTWSVGDAICDLQEVTQATVDDAVSVKVAACVDGASVLIPYVEGLDSTVNISEGAGIDIDSAPIGDDMYYQISLDLCELPPSPKIEYDAAADAAVAVCVDGDSKKVSREDAYAIFEQHIAAGTDIAITGSGTEADPYIVDNTQTEVFISAVQGDTDGGTINVDASNNIVLTRSDGVEWTMHIPEHCEAGNGGEMQAGDVLVGCDNRSYTVPSAALALDPATMNLNNPVPFSLPPNNGTVDVDTISYIDDPLNILTHIGGGIRVNRDGVYLVMAEITTTNNAGYVHVGIYLNGVALDTGFPNAGAHTTGALNATQMGALSLSNGDILKTGIQASTAASNINHGNLSVTLLG